MKISRRIGLGAAALGLSACLATAGIGQEPVKPEGKGEKVGEKVGRVVDRAIRDVREGADEVADTLRSGFARARTAVDQMGVEARIYGRLHWDKALADAEFDLELRDGGVAVLRGAVADAAAKAKAIELAGSTVGVNRVVDELKVRPAVRTEGTPATAAPDRDRDR